MPSSCHNPTAPSSCHNVTILHTSLLLHVANVTFDPFCSEAINRVGKGEGGPEVNVGAPDTPFVHHTQCPLSFPDSLAAWRST